MSCQWLMQRFSLLTYFSFHLQVFNFILIAKNLELIFKVRCTIFHDIFKWIIKKKKSEWKLFCSWPAFELIRRLSGRWFSKANNWWKIKNVELNEENFFRSSVIEIFDQNCSDKFQLFPQFSNHSPDHPLSFFQFHYPLFSLISRGKT